MDVDNIIKNSKTLKQLTKDISDIAKNQGGGSSGGGVTGINRVDDKIDDIKESIANNATVQFFKDPAGTLGKGIRGVIKPFADIPGNLMDGFKKLNPFGLEGIPVKKALSNLEKTSKEQTKLLKTIAGASTAQSDEIADSISEGLGQTVLRDQVRSLNLQDSSLKEITRLRLQAEILPERLSGFLVAPINKLVSKAADARDRLFARFRKDDTNQAIKDKSAQREVFRDAVQNFGMANEADTETQMIQRQSHFLENQALFNTMSMALKLSAEHLGKIDNYAQQQLRYFVGGDQTQDLFNLEERQRQRGDQQQAEKERDAELKTQERHEQLINALSGIDPRSGGDEKEKKEGMGLFAWIKKNFLGIGAGAAAASARVAGGIGGLFLGMISTLTEGFRILGRRRVMVSRGALTLGIMSLGLASLAIPLYTISKAMNVFTPEKAKGAAGILAILAGAMIGLGFLMTGPQAVITLAGVGLLAMLGTAMIGLGYAFKLAGGGLEPAAELFTALAQVKWSTFFLAGPALSALASALQGFRGLPKIQKGDDSALDQISQMGEKIAGSLPGAADPIKTFQTAISGLDGLDISMGIGDGLENIYEATDKRDFKTRLENAGAGIRSLLSDINAELNNLNEDALNKVASLLSGDSTMLTTSNMSGPLINNVSTANGIGGGQSPVIVDNSTGGSNSNISVVQQVVPHINDNTLGLLA